MARVTVEDCLKHVENRFELVLKAAVRAHALEMGAADPLVPLDNDKPTVIALREIAANKDFNQALVEQREAEEAADLVMEASGFIIEDIETEVSVEPKDAADKSE